ncbi:MAG: type II secretion system F family protein [Spirochaetia bacterium]|nr:type II secretion system F family protein [Spirochaetia bacterium]
MKIILLLLITASVSAFAGGVAIIIHRRSALAQLTGAGKNPMAGRLAGYARYVMDYLLRINSKFTGAAGYIKIKAMLDSLSPRLDIQPEYFLLLEQACAAAGFIIGRLAVSSPLAGVACGAAAFFVPRGLLYSRVKKQAEDMVRELPDAFDIIGASIEGGLSLNMALARYASSSKSVFAGELQNCLKKTNLGSPFEDAMRSMEQRLRVPEVTYFADVFIQADRLGGNVRDIIKAQADEIRKKRFQYLKKKAHEAPVKMLIPLILFIFPVIFIVLFGPVVIRLLNGL